MDRRTFLTSIAGGTAGTAVAASTPISARTQAGVLDDDLLNPETIDPDERRVQLDIAPSGDADWELTFETALDDEDAVAAFERVEDDPELEREAAEERLETALAVARPSVDRQLGVESLAVSTTRPQEDRGELVIEFRWTGFAAIETDALVIGDLLGPAFLAAADRLTVQWPQGHEVDLVDPQPDQRSDPNRLLVWEDGSAASGDGLSARFVTGGDGLPLWFAAGTMGGLLAMIGTVFYVFGRGSRSERPDQRDRGQKPFETVDEEDKPADQ